VFSPLSVTGYAVQYAKNIEENKMKIQHAPQLDTKNLFLVGQEIISFRHVDSAVTE
jgi:hypothetical protein